MMQAPRHADETRRRAMQRRRRWRHWVGYTAGAAALAAAACRAPPVVPARGESPPRATPQPAGAESVRVAPGPPGPALPETAPAPAAPGAGGAVEVFPGVRVDRAARVVEFDGIVPIDCHDPDAPAVFLEVVVCTPDTKEHESLVMTGVKASHVHAALLLLGLEPGSPGSWEVRGVEPVLVPVDPRGPAIGVDITYRDASGREVTADAREWVVDAKSGARLGARGPEAGVRWVFAGSRFVEREGQRVYDADGVGTLVGLCTFGSETVAWGRTISPDSQVHEPEWIANAKAVPAAGTAVVVRLRALEP
jgi:hypothetical protein